jgi:hypothetical protein
VDSFKRFGAQGFSYRAGLCFFSNDMTRLGKSERVMYMLYLVFMVTRVLGDESELMMVLWMNY